MNREGIIKRIIKKILYLYEKNIFISYMKDAVKYKKYQYNNPKMNSINSHEAKILRQAHMLEKGMALSSPRRLFGVEKAKELIEMIHRFQLAGYSVEKNEVVIDAIGVLYAYVNFHEKKGDDIHEIKEKLLKFSKFYNEKGVYGTLHITKEELNKCIHSEFLEFFKSRHSVRQFADKDIDVNDIKKIVELAMHAPSACNRQSCKVYYYDNKLLNASIAKIVGGNTGFEKDAKGYLVVTSDISSFYDSAERNQTYVDGGIFALALIEACHYYGMASCIIQNGENYEREKAIRLLLKNIPLNEKVILFIAIGYYRDEFEYAVSNRKAVKDVLIVTKEFID